MTITNIIKDLPKHQTKRFGKRSLNKIDEITIHHSATNGTVKNIAEYHVNTLGWPGIGYHFVINTNGEIYQVNYLTTLSYHSKGRNTRAVGICLIGDYSTKEPNFKMIKSLDSLVEHLKGAIEIKSIKPHNETKATICPGEYLTKFVKKNYQ